MTPNMMVTGISYFFVGIVFMGVGRGFLSKVKNPLRILDILVTITILYPLTILVLGTGLILIYTETFGVTTAVDFKTVAGISGVVSLILSFAIAKLGVAYFK